MWKHLNALPSRGPTQIIAKHILALVAVVVATLGLVVTSLATVAVLSFLHPEMDLGLREPPVPRVAALGLALALGDGIAIVPPLMVIAARARRNCVGFTLGASAIATVLGNSLPATMPATSAFPWSMGVLWSSVLEREPGDAQRILWAVGASFFWVALSVAIHVALEKRTRSTDPKRALLALPTPTRTNGGEWRELRPSALLVGLIDNRYFAIGIAYFATRFTFP